MQRKYLRSLGLSLLLGASLLLGGCGARESSSGASTTSTGGEVTTEAAAEAGTATDEMEPNTNDGSSETEEPAIIIEEDFSLMKSLKTQGNTNPIMTQAYGADPYALVYGDTVYIYMTADAYEYDASGEIKDNSYSKIRSIHVVSTKDMKNFTDCGEIPVAGKNGIAKWASNSWAPAAAWKNIDGQDKFFLYFADNGGGIGVLEGDSPVGPFYDPLGEALVSRKVPNAGNVLWLFDPAVLVDDDGTGYLYFGGGVPDGKAADPGTGRVVQLGDDMISLACDPVAIDVPYLFEDSGIHKYGDTYYYTYCTNWNVDEEGKAKYGFDNGQIACLTSKSPMGPFTYSEKILNNPGTACGLYGNNHHAVFCFKDQWYIVYHSRQLEKNAGVEKGYRATFVNTFNFKEDGSIGLINQSQAGPDQLQYVDPYAVNSAVCVSNMVGTNAVAFAGDATTAASFDNGDKPYGTMVLGEIESGDYVEITGVDFGEGATSVTFTAAIPEGCAGRVYVRVKYPNSTDYATLDLTSTGGEYKTFTASLTEPLTDVQYLYLVFAGEGFTVKDWQFAK